MEKSEFMLLSTNDATKYIEEHYDMDAQKAPKRPEPNSKFSSYLVLLIYVKSIL